MNGRVPGNQPDGQDVAIEFDIEADFPLRQQYMEWNGLADNEGSDETQITLLEYISYINSQYLKTVS